MIKDFDILINKYAKLIIKRGLNLPKGKYVRIISDISQTKLIHALVKECYKAQSKRVFVSYTCEEVDKTILDMTPINEVKKLYEFDKKEMEFFTNDDVYTVYIESENPNYLNNIDSKKINNYFSSRQKYRHNLLAKNNYYRAPHTIVCAASPSWAKYLFPKLKEEDAIIKLWDYIFSFCLINKKDDPIKCWDKHCSYIDNHADTLNKLNIKELHFKSNNGTDFKVGMTDKYKFAGAPDFDTKNKVNYYSNIPTEECFVSPHRLKVDGTIVASKPFVENGHIIEGAKFILKKGRIVSYSAKRNFASLKAMIEEEENMHYLGEIALVPFSSPINKTKLIFMNTLIDENSCCHFAIGSSYTYTYKGYERLKKNELLNKGLNYANNHVDIMIGSNDLKIIATLKNNKKVVIFNKGEWAI